ncbi:hypothetical protein GCK72_017391 [Caenorhabditis remanei]|uniref:Uncharacterized protein n=1 Tax=Caenorhabditis remanei TaxID=31234 RepID=A0A6A5G737_CAERE|nr:hypothetical protein GCK72_017391 [Caenorhabditis remanei]KAF1750840.1 hypothetical protein GCK72_017391 [Caenorhabditis remanei]
MDNIKLFPCWKQTYRLVNDDHYASEDIQKTLAELQSRWEHLLELLGPKWLQVQNYEWQNGKRALNGTNCDNLP